MKVFPAKILKDVHSVAPLWLSGLYMPLIYFTRHLMSIYLKGYQMEGQERVTGAHVKVIYYGTDERIRNYWTNMLFEDQPVVSRLSTEPVWKILKSGEKYQYQQDLLIMELNRLTRRLVSLRKGFILPRWFETLINVDNSIDAINHNDTHKHIQKHGFSMEERNSLEDLKLFYERMFNPYIRSRHKDSSVIPDYSYFAKRFFRKDSRLFFLLKENKPVAGSFNEREGGMIKFSGLGVLDGDKEVLQMGAIRVLYYFMLDYYSKSDVSTIRYGGTSPLLSDGLTLFKVSMRAYPNPHKIYGEKSLYLLPDFKSSSARDVLKSNPFIFISHRRVYRALFIESSAFEDKKELLRLLKMTNFRRIAGTKLFYWGDRTKISSLLDEEEITNIELINCDTDLV